MSPEVDPAAGSLALPALSKDSPLPDADAFLVEFWFGAIRAGLISDMPLTNLAGKHWNEPVPPEPSRLVADVDTTLEQQILDLVQRFLDT